VGISIRTSALHLRMIKCQNARNCVPGSFNAVMNAKEIAKWIARNYMMEISRKGMFHPAKSTLERSYHVVMKRRWTVVFLLTNITLKKAVKLRSKKCYHVAII
jgi:hypothetical protein